MILKISILYSGKNFFEKNLKFIFCMKKYFMNTFSDSGKKIFEKKLRPESELCSDAGRCIV